MVWKPSLLSFCITVHSQKMTRSPVPRSGRDSKLRSILFEEACRLLPGADMANKTSRSLRTKVSHPISNALLSPLSWSPLSAPVGRASALLSHKEQKRCLPASFAATNEKPALENDSCGIVWARMGGGLKSANSVLKPDSRHGR